MTMTERTFEVKDEFGDVLTVTAEPRSGDVYVEGKATRSTGDLEMAYTLKGARKLRRTLKKAIRHIEKQRGESGDKR